MAISHLRRGRIVEDDGSGGVVEKPARRAGRGVSSPRLPAKARGGRLVPAGLATATEPTREIVERLRREIARIGDGETRPAGL